MFKSECITETYVVSIPLLHNNTFPDSKHQSGVKYSEELPNVERPVSASPTPASPHLLASNTINPTLN